MEKINNDPGITEITEINGDKKNKIKYNERKTLNGENKGSSDGVTELWNGVIAKVSPDIHPPFKGVTSSAREVWARVGKECCRRQQP